MTRCDATYVTEAGACSDDRVTVWHGMSDPAIACGKHANHGGQAVYAGHRKRLALASN